MIALAERHHPRSAGAEVAVAAVAPLDPAGQVAVPVVDRGGVESDGRAGGEGRAARAMLAARWPHNVRALEQALATAWALTAGERPLTVDDFADALGDDAPAAAPDDDDDDAPAGDGARKQQLDELLTTFKGNLSAVARALGRDRVLVRRWLVRHGLDPEKYRR